MGYVLTTDACGAYFNDNSKLVLASDNYSLNYFEKGPDKVEARESYSMKSYPPTLKKKVTLLMHFKTHLESVKPEINF